jgi:hypothetical protein
LYWARGQAGPYSVTTSYITAHKRYAFEPIPIFMLGKDGEIIADDASHVTFETMGNYIDEHTGKPVSNNATRYIYTKGSTSYVVTRIRHRGRSVARFTGGMGQFTKVVARIIHFDAAYFRFTGELRVSTTALSWEHYVDDAICEQMHFGHARP